MREQRNQNDDGNGYAKKEQQQGSHRSSQKVRYLSRRDEEVAPTSAVGRRKTRDKRARQQGDENP